MEGIEMKIGQEFMEKTKYQYEEDSDQEKGIKQPPLQLEYNKGSKIIDLPEPLKISVKDISLREVIEERHSVRVYKDCELTLEELSYLLWCTQGVKKVIREAATLRNVPSAGARHAFETYLLINRVEGLNTGLYRYIALENKLVEVNIEEGTQDKVVEACLGQKFIKNSAVTFIWTAVPYRMNWRYGERGYRYLHLDAGHVCQNLYLAAENIDCGVCAVAAFDDDELNSVLNIDGKEQFAIYIGTVGKR
jgi:SagB-type dehydrogenase family enzyme